MPLDPSYKDLNRASRERSRALVNRLTDGELQTKVGEHWMVGIVFAHLAFWERRVMYVLEDRAKRQTLHPRDRHLRERSVFAVVGGYPTA